LDTPEGRDEMLKLLITGGNVSSCGTGASKLSRLFYHLVAVLTEKLGIRIIVKE
jgi:hypothetical protein